MSLRTNYGKSKEKPTSDQEAKKAIDLIIAQVGGSIVYFDKAKKFIE